MFLDDNFRILLIDMSARKISIDKTYSRKLYMGGVGLASKLLEDHMYPQKEPIDPDQPIVFAIGPLSTIYPVITKVVSMFISPLTGELGESYAGGRFALSMFSAGFDAIVIKGGASKPCYISISDNEVLFRDARPMWGSEKDNIGRIIRFEERHGGTRSIVRIGEGGENKVSFAAVTVDRYRHFGRMGLGALFGAKNLKAINIAGSYKRDISSLPKYFKVYRKIYDICANSDTMKKYHDIGTPVNVLPLNAANALPTKNLQQSSFEHADKISGEVFSEHRQVRKLACAGCPVGCIHIGQFRRAFNETGYEYETINVGYDYELIFALGSFLGLSNPEHILELIEEVEIAGLDSMSTGVALGWATEVLNDPNTEVTEEHTIEKLEFGKYEAYLKAVHHISKRKNDFYTALGMGVKAASEKYGGTSYAMHIAGNEMPGYHTGYGSLVGVAVGARHSHLDNGGYSIDQGMKPLDVDEIVDALLKEEIERCMLNSLVICLFARKVYDRDTILEAFDAIGMPLTNEDLDAVAKRTFATKLRIKQKLGFKLPEIKFPKRFFKTVSMNGLLDEDTAMNILLRYDEKINGMEGFE